MKLSDIKPGMIIEYRGRAYGHRNLIGKQETRRGTVTQVTPNLIAVQGQRYPDTILVNDLLSGQVKIISLKGEGEMVKKLDWETLGPQIDELRAQGKTIKAIAEELGIGETTTQSYLANQKQTPTLEPEQAANQEPDEGEGESATEIIPDTKAYYTEPVNIPLGCLLPPQGAELLRNEREPANGCGDTTSDTKTNYGQGRGQSGEINWPPRDNVEKVLLENIINASFAVRRVLNDPVALALMKQVLESGVV